MIAYFLQEGQKTARVLKQPQEVCSFLGTTVRIVQQEHSLYLRIPHTLRYMIKNPIKHGSKLVLENQDSGRIGTICFSAYDRGYTQFRRIKRVKSCMSLGNTIDCDLYLQDANLSGVLTLDWQQHVLLDPSCFFFPDGSAEFKNGDRFLILNLVLVFHEDFLMINRVENLYTSLTDYVPPLIKEPLCTSMQCVSLSRFRAPVLNGTFQEELSEPLPMKERTFNPLRFSIGPALLMSSAALLNAVLSSKRMYGAFDLEKSLSMLIFPCVMILSSLLFHPMQRAYEKKQMRIWNKRREKEYGKYLEELKLRIEEHRAMYAEELRACFPWPYEVGFQQLIKQKTVFQKDFLIVRIGDAELDYDLQLKQSFRFALEDPLAHEVEQLKQNFKSIHVPVLLDCTKSGCVALVGKMWDRILENIVVQIVATVQSDACSMVLLADENWVKEHDWVYLIPHLYEDASFRCIVTGSEEARKVCGLLKQHPKDHLILLVQDMRCLSMFPTESACVLLGCPDSVIPSFCNRYYVQADNPLFYQSGRLIQMDPHEWNEKYDWSNLAFLEEARNKEWSTNAFLRQFHVDSIEELKIRDNWEKTKNEESLLARIGEDEENELMILDLSEKGHGPHGLIAGTTGSGKSEFILSLILSLAVQYAPDRLNFILIDFKGAGCAHALSAQSVLIPHVAGVLSNLDSGHMDRALVSFRNECRYRESLFHELSLVCDRNISSLSLYRKAQKEHPEFEVLADLVLIVDEFAELKKEYPEFMSELISISRIGRSLGLHMILSTQRPMGVVDEQIWSNSHFKICLKVQEPQDSKELLHRPDAAWIQRAGEYYLLCDDLFKHGFSAYTGAPAKTDGNEVRVLDSMAMVKKVFRSTTEESSTLAHELVHRILQVNQSYGVQARAIWQPEPKQVSIQEAPKDSTIYLGLGDDYHYNRHVWTGWDPFVDAHVAVFSDDRKERMHFLNLFLCELLRTSGPGDEIALVDESNWMEGKEEFVHAVVRSERALLMYLNHVAKAQVQTTIIFTDLASFLRQSSNCPQILHDLLTMKVYEHVHVIVLAATFQMIPYRDYGFFSQRIALATKSTTLLSGVFETSVRTIVEPGTALVQQDYFMTIRLASCTKEDLEERYGNRNCSLYRFPFSQEELKPMISANGRRLLGVQCNSYSPVLIEKDEMLIVECEKEEACIVDQRWLLPSARILCSKEIFESRNNVHKLLVGSWAEKCAPDLFMRKARGEHEAVHVYRGRRELIELVGPWNCSASFVFLLCADFDGS